MKKKVLSLFLAAAMVMSLGVYAGAEESTEAGTDASYDEESAAIYDAQLGEFYDIYEEALGEESVSMRFAKMAIAEAKLLESAVTLPTSTKGGSIG